MKGLGALQAALLAAHEADDRPALVTLYREAAEAAEAAGEHDRACFFLTHAYVFALETAHPERRSLHERLKAAGREE